MTALKMPSTSPYLVHTNVLHRKRTVVMIFTHALRN